MKPSTLLKVFSCAFLLFPVVADALEMPQPKLGQWEMRTQNSYDGAPLTAVDTSQFCWDVTMVERSRKMGEENKKNCSKSEVRKEGSKWIISSVCKAGDTLISTQSTHEINGENAYREDTYLTFAPPLTGYARSHLIVDMKWLGPCK